MRKLLDGSIVVAVVLVITLAYNSNYLSYYNCMEQVKLDYISKRGAEHIVAQCKAFVLDEIMVN